MELPGKPKHVGLQRYSPRMAFLLSNNSNSLLSRLRSTQHRQQEQVIDVLLLPLSRLFFCSFVFSSPEVIVLNFYSVNICAVCDQCSIGSAHRGFHFELGAREKGISFSFLIYYPNCFFVFLFVCENLQKSIGFDPIGCSFNV